MVISWLYEEHYFEDCSTSVQILEIQKKVLCKNLRWTDFYLFISDDVITHILPASSNADIFYKYYESF